MRFANPILVRANFERIFTVAACAGYSLKDKLKAADKTGSYSVRSAPKSSGQGSPGSQGPCSLMGVKNGDDKKGGGPGASKPCGPCNKELRTLTSGSAAPQESEGDMRSPAQDQLCEFKRSKPAPACLTTSVGGMIGSKTASMTVGQRGTMLLQDFVFMDEVGHFNRERIPERVVNAKGAGAFGQFEVTHDITKYCKSCMFKVGKKTPVAVRFSNFCGERGSADSIRDMLGFSIKFYTEEGNWDLVGSNLPVFFLRDPIHFASFVHSQRRNPVTHLKDPDMFWDFIASRPETTHALLFMFTDRGLPEGYRRMHGYGNHTFKMVNKDGCVYYAKFFLKSNQGLSNFTVQEAKCLSGNDPDFAVRDLYNAIGRKDYPVWLVYAQIISEEDARCAKDWNPFDCTKVWPHDYSRMVPIGKLMLNRNPKNYFAEVEQLAFSPAHMIPGIEPSPDKVLQGRLFAYSDAQRYRLGVNYNQIPVNCPYKTKIANYQRDGQMCVDCNQDGSPNYYPNTFNGPVENCRYLETPMCVFGEVARYETAEEDNFTQASIFYRNVLTPEDQDHMATNIANSLREAKSCIQFRVLDNLYNVDPELVLKIQMLIGSNEPGEEDYGYQSEGMNDNNNRKK